MGKKNKFGKRRIMKLQAKFGNEYKAFGSGNPNATGAPFKRNFMNQRRNRGKWSLDLTLDIPNWSAMNLEEVKKDFYQEHALVKARDAVAVKEYRDQNRISFSGRDCPKPVQAFDECNFAECIATAVKAQNFVTPTPIQAQALPVALSGRDLVGIAETGSGKTLAFILPAITHIHGKVRSSNPGEPDVVVLAPTRELAQQIHQVVEGLGPCVKVTSECFYGGTKREEQKICAEKVFEICIATPGRLADFIHEKLVKLHRCTYFVLDEADRMLDMGFEPQIKMIIPQARPERQMLMFSATWPTEIRNLAEKYLSDYVLVNVGSLEISANHDITQKIEICEESDKPQRIVKAMKYVMKHEEKKTLIFVNSKVDVDLLTIKFRLNGWAALGLHGAKKQNERDRVFGDFKTGKIDILIATDLAARGLDVDDIKFIINYDYPKSSEDYVHRIGRTGRCGRTGTAITFFTRGDRRNAEDLISVLEEAGQNVPPGLHDLIHLPPPATSAKTMRPKEFRKRKSQLKKLVTRSEINIIPLGTPTDTETLPDLDEIFDPLLLANAVPGTTGKKRKVKRLRIPQLMAAFNQKQASKAAMKVQSPKKQVNSNTPPVVPKGQESFMRDNAQNKQLCNEKPSVGSKTSLLPPHDDVMRKGESSMHQQQQGMAPHFGMPFPNASVTGRRNDRFSLDVRNTGMPMDHQNSGSSWGPRRMGMSVDSRNMGLLMHPRNIASPQNQSRGGMGWHGIGSSAGNYMGHQNSNWGNYRSNYSLNQAGMNCNFAQNNWSGSGYNNDQGRYHRY